MNRKYVEKKATNAQNEHWKKMKVSKIISSWSKNFIDFIVKNNFPHLNFFLFYKKKITNHAHTHAHIQTAIVTLKIHYYFSFRCILLVCVVVVQMLCIEVLFLILSQCKSSSSSRSYCHMWEHNMFYCFCLSLFPANIRTRVERIKNLWHRIK